MFSTSLSKWAGLVIAGTLLFAMPMQVQAANLVLVGGGLQDDNAAIYNRIVSLAGGRSVAKIGILTAASIPASQDPDAGTANASNSQANGEYYANLFKATYGALDAQWIPIDLDHIANNASPSVVNQINSMTGFFIGGGDQSRLVTCLLNSDRTDSPALAAIRSKWNSGAIVAGTSAGTAILAQSPMITGGESYEALRYGSYTSVSGDNLSYDPKGGFGFFKEGLIDTHFSERGRQGRIVRLASDTGKSAAYGVDENTALVVTGEGTSSAKMEVLGQNGAFVFDLSAATKGTTGGYWSISNVKATYLTPGDLYTPATKAVTFASYKSNIAGKEAYSYAMTPTLDIFSSPNNYRNGSRVNPREFVDVSTDLFDSRSSTSTYGETHETNPIFKVTMTKVTGSVGYVGTSNGTESISYKDMKLDIVRK
ncbi:cyanophycinase [Tumebacillus sp. DT12]|uniref:Cyanophycinase n=1 Tax=Tumebacillus lacus TaxID=2995335 RepID=A0ABT3WYL0_9BACL|nr:cyanophycinase [Tumebacillus lacus]MCX7569754.1 cyanophycinase [Tumebacillus lacus]